MLTTIILILCVIGFIIYYLSFRLNIRKQVFTKRPKRYIKISAINTVFKPPTHFSRECM